MKLGTYAYECHLVYKNNQKQSLVFTNFNQLPEIRIGELYNVNVVRPLNDKGSVQKYFCFSRLTMESKMEIPNPVHREHYAYKEHNSPKILDGWSLVYTLERLKHLSYVEFDF